MNALSHVTRSRRGLSAHGVISRYPELRLECACSSKQPDSPEVPFCLSSCFALAATATSAWQHDESAMVQVCLPLCTHKIAWYMEHLPLEGGAQPLMAEPSRTLKFALTTSIPDPLGSAGFNHHCSVVASECMGIQASSSQSSTDMQGAACSPTVRLTIISLKRNSMAVCTPSAVNPGSMMQRSLNSCECLERPLTLRKSASTGVSMFQVNGCCEQSTSRGLSSSGCKACCMTLHSQEAPKAGPQLLYRLPLKVLCQSSSSSSSHWKVQGRAGMGCTPAPFYEQPDI